MMRRSVDIPGSGFPPSAAGHSVRPVGVSETGTRSGRLALLVVLFATLALLAAQPAIAAKPGNDNQRITALEAQVADLTARVEALEAAWPTPQPSTSPTGAPTPPASASPTPTAPSPTAAPPSGWTLIFSDDFSENVPEGQFAIAGDNWGGYPYPWPDTSRNGYWDRGIVSQHDGLMDMHLRQVDGTWRSASVSPRDAGGTIYETSLRIELRMWATASDGYHASFLTWPITENWPQDGELDYPEGRLDRTVSAFTHRQGATSGSDQDAFSTSSVFTVPHTYLTEWVAGQYVRYYLDGALVGESLNRVPTNPMRIQLQVQTRLSGGAPSPGTSAHVYVDWIRVSTRSGT